MKKKNFQSTHSSHHPNDSHTSSSIHKGKQFSMHTKTSINDHANSRITTRSANKIKKSQFAKGKEKPPEKTKKTHLTSSKSSKKMMKICFQKKSKKDYVLMNDTSKVGMLSSCREYCIVENSFVPLANSHEKRFLNTMMTAPTACTSKSFQTSEIKKVSIGTDTFKVQFKDHSILVKANMQDQGIQYTPRTYRQMTEDFKKFTDQEQKQTLFDTCYRIQCDYLPDQTNFQDLEPDQKQYLRTVLRSVLEKLRSPRREPPNERFVSMNPEIAVLNILRGETDVRQRDHELELKILYRLAQQRNQQNIYFQEDTIDTSTKGVINVFDDICSFIELEYSEQFVMSMNTIYGWSYREKYKYISKLCNEFEDPLYQILSIMKSKEINFKPIPDVLFQEFVYEVLQKYETLGPSEELKWHCKCIFDCLNQFLLPFKPYFTNKGQPFPWCIILIHSITFYSIDSESIEVVFAQLRQKIFLIAQEYLCGILVNDYEPVGGRSDPVSEFRMQREEKLILDEVDQTSYESDLSGVDMSVTFLLFQLSIQVIDDMMVEATGEIMNIC